MRDRDVYEWVDPFEALDTADWAYRRMIDHQDDLAGRLQEMRERHLHETAALRAMNEHLLKVAAELAPIQMPAFLKREA